MHVRRNSTGDTKLDFWGSCKPTCYESFGDQFSFSTELQIQAEGVGDERFGYSSPRLWSSNRSGNINQESSPLLPKNHHYSNLSPNSRRRVIVEGRRELMAMVQNMPESSYELSLKDIVDEQRSLEEDEEENSVVKDGSSDFKAETQIRKLKKMNNRNTNRGLITRTGSMESETFLIKMLFPTSLGSKKKAKPGNQSRVLSLKSPEPSEKDMEKVWWTKGLFFARSKTICRSSTSGSTSSSNSSSRTSRSISNSNSSSSRCASERDFIPGCWSFFPSRNRNSKSMRERGCIF